MADTTRRHLIVGFGASAAALVLGIGDAATAAAHDDADGPQSTPPTFTLEAHGASEDHAVVIVRKASAASVTVTHGSTRASADVIAGVAVVGLAVPKNAVTTLTVTAGSDSQDVDVDTRVEALRTSPVRIVNKRIALGKDDDPKNVAPAHGVMLDERIAKPLDRLLARAEKDDAALVVLSGFRAFDTQKTLYAQYEKRDGQKAADTYSARPGHSEHQLGLAIDVVGTDHAHELTQAFKSTAAGRWIAAHAHEFGFVVRYPDGQEKVTGYHPEPWHLRFVGESVATYLHARHDVETLEKLFALPDAPGY